MKYVIPTVLASVPVLLPSDAFADPCSDAICSLAGYAASSLGTNGILSLLAAGVVILGVWFYHRRGRVDGSVVREQTDNLKL